MVVWSTEIGPGGIAASPTRERRSRVDKSTRYGAANVSPVLAGSGLITRALGMRLCVSRYSYSDVAGHQNGQRTAARELECFEDSILIYSGDGLRIPSKSSVACGENPPIEAEKSSQRNGLIFGNYRIILFESWVSNRASVYHVNVL